MLLKPTDFKETYTSIHLLYHRNKNQHRLAKWWKAFSALKRAVSKLADEVERLAQLTRGGEEEEIDLDVDVEEDEKEGLLRAMRGVRWGVVPRCYLAFSTVIADVQFSALGVVLMALLSRVARLVTSEETRHPLWDDDTAAVTGKRHGVEASSAHREDRIIEDLGEVVQRDGEGGVETVELKKKRKDTKSMGEEGADEAEKKVKKRKKRASEDVALEKGIEKTEERKKKKKSKKSNAIDDIFSGL